MSHRCSGAHYTRWAFVFTLRCRVFPKTKTVENTFRKNQNERITRYFNVDFRRDVTCRHYPHSGSAVSSCACPTSANRSARRTPCVRQTRKQYRLNLSFSINFYIDFRTVTFSSITNTNENT